MKTRCEINSIHAKAKAGALDGRRMWNTWLKKKGTNSFTVCSPAYGKRPKHNGAPFFRPLLSQKLSKRGLFIEGWFSVWGSLYRVGK